jgi:integrase/recombinase XerD
MPSLNSLFEMFLRERTYIRNVSPKTRIWYESAWKSFTATQRPMFADDAISTACPIAREHLTAFVVRLRERGLRTVTVNTWLRALNAFCRWLHEEGHSRERVSVRPLCVEKRFVKTLDDAALRAILSHRPRDYAHRVQTLAAAILDTGCRIDELLSARCSAIDLDNLLLTVVGKGDKQRIVPFSFELRKRLVRFAQVRDKRGILSEWMFSARNGGRWHQRNALRSYYLLPGRIGIPKSGFHRLRHTFATQYLRHGDEPYSQGRQFIQEHDQVPKVAPETIQPPDNQRVELPAFRSLHQSIQSGARFTRPTDSTVHELDGLPASRLAVPAEFSKLVLGLLIKGAHARVDCCPHRATSPALKI